MQLSLAGLRFLQPHFSVALVALQTRKLIEFNLHKLCTFSVAKTHRTVNEVELQKRRTVSIVSRKRQLDVI